jgi:hypothetical protein
MQRSFGNGYTRRAIERSRITDHNSTARYPHHIGQHPDKFWDVRAHASAPQGTIPFEALKSEASIPSLEITPSFAAPSDSPPNLPNKQAPGASENPALMVAGDTAPTPGGIHRSVGAEPALGSEMGIAPGPVIRRKPVCMRAPTANTGAVIQRGLLDDFGEAVSDVASSAADTVSDVASDAVDAVSDVASSAVEVVSGVIDSAIAELRGAFNAIVEQVSGVWETVKSGVTNAVDGAIREATGFLSGIGAFFGAIGTALSTLDVDSLRAAWAAITGAAGAALAGVQGLVAHVTGTIDSLWSGLKGLADGLMGGLRSRAEGLIGRLPGAAQGPARSLWRSIEEKLTSTWRAIESSWSALRESALKRVTQIVARVAGVVTSIKNSVISTIIETLDQVKGLFTFIKQLIANPDLLIDPIVQEITKRLQGLPDKAKADAQTKAQEQAASGPGATGAGPSTAQAAPSVNVQRFIQRDAAPAGQPRSTLSIGQVISGGWNFITDKLAKLWANLGTTIKEMVVGVLDPRAIWKGLKEDWGHMTEELSKRANRFESIRTDSWDSFSEDLSRWISNLVDFPLIIWRTANAMLGRLSVYIGLAIILGGAVAGAIAGGTGGAIFGSVVPAAGTAAGGGVGILGGAWAGAQAGYALAETVGLVLLVSFVMGEQISIIKALNDLLWVPQSEEEQSEDFNQATDSIIAVGTAGLLMLIAFIGVAIAKRVWAFVKSIPGRFKPKPKVVEVEPTGPKPVEPPVTKSNKVIICRMCVELKMVPEDILARRAKLSPEMQQFLDDKLNNFVKDPLNPTPAEFERLRKMMDGIEKATGGDLEAGLRAAKARENPPVKPPFGSEAAELPRLRDAAEQLLAEIDDFVAKNPDKETIRRAGKRLKNDIDGVLKDMETGKTEATPERIEGFENNLKGVQGEFDAAKTAPPGTQFGVSKSGHEIDRISPDGSRWTNDKNFNLFGKDDPRVADLKAQAEATIKIAQLPEHGVGGKAPEVEFHFGKGVTPEVAAELRTVNVNGQSLIVTGPELPLNP